MEAYSIEDAAQKALEWCKEHKGWQRICDLTNSDYLYKDWEELSEKEKNPWIRDFGQLGAEDAWKNFGKKKCKVPFGFVTGKGEFYKDILKVSPLHNIMMVFKV